MRNRHITPSPRLLAILALLIPALAPVAFAQSGEIADGKLTDKTWNLEYAAPGLERTISTQQPSVIFEGRVTGGVQVEIAVLEAPEKKDGKQWMERLRELWTKAKREMANPEVSTEGTPTILFTETKLDVFTEQHGYAFYARGSQCFLVHAFVADKTDKSGADIKAALQGLKLGEDPGASLFALIISQRAGLPVDHPLVLLDAGVAYANPQGQNQEPNYPMAARILSQARKVMKEDSYSPTQLWLLYEIGGLSHLSPPLRDAKVAIDWHGKAEEAAKKLGEEEGRMQRQAQSAYNLACAYSLAGEVEKGFEALYRAFAETMTVDKAHLTSDKDLDNLKNNKELWDKFWKEKVEGR